MEVIFEIYIMLITLIEYSIVFQSINMTFVLRNNHACFRLIYIKREIFISIKQTDVYLRKFNV